MSEIELERAKLKRIARTLRREFSRFDLTDRERRVAEMVLDLCTSLGIRSVSIPKLELFASLTGMTKGNVSSTISSLDEIGVITVDHSPGGPRYSVNPSVNDWKLRVRVSRDTYRQTLSLIMESNHIHPVGDDL